MSKPLGVDLSAGPEALGVLALRGADAARFLQGQLSADIEKLAPGASTLAGLHNPQGRVIALLALVRTTADEVLATLPRELATGVAERLRKFVFRAKVRIEDESAQHTVVGAWTTRDHPGVPAIAWAERRLLLVTGGEFEQADGFSADAWRLADVADGIPQVYAATSESFVAQMLNLDLLGAIAFDKGCYTGQEVVARAHYRGRVKRRMQRWSVDPARAPRPGDSARTADGRALTVVRVAPGGALGVELLAVGNYAPMPQEAVTDADAGKGILVQGPLPLPYPLPA